MEHNNRKRKAIILFFLVLSLTVYPVLATTIFSDGQVGSTQETAHDFSAWTGTSGTPTVSTDYAHHGTYSFKSSTAGSGSNAYYYKNFAEVSEVYIRFYLYLDSVASNSESIFFVQLKGEWQNGMALGIIGTTRTLYRTGDGTGSDTSTTTLSLTAWHYIELYFLKGSGTGISKVYLDGVEVSDLTEIGLTQNFNIQTLNLGHFSNWRGTVTNYVDCVVVADTHIGVEVSGQDLTFSLSQTIYATSSASMLKEKGFSLSEIAHLTSAFTQQKELGFPLSVTVKATSTLTMNKEIFVVIHEWLYSLQETAHLTSNLYTDLEIAEKVSLGLGFYIGVLALVIALMAYLRSRH